MSYIFKYKRFVTRSIKGCKGHNYNIKTDRMDVFHDNGITSIPFWSKHTLFLGKDFLLFEKENAKKESNGKAVL